MPKPRATPSLAALRRLIRELDEAEEIAAQPLPIGCGMACMKADRDRIEAVTNKIVAEAKRLCGDSKKVKRK